MRKPIKHRLSRKGWQEPEIKKVEEAFEKVTLSKGPRIKVIDQALYWLLLAITIVLNIVIAIVLVPLMISLDGYYLYPILVLVGFSFGAFLSLVLKSMEITSKHHTFAGIFMLFTSLLVFLVIVMSANRLSMAIGLGMLRHNEWMVAVVYSVSFILPFLLEYEIYERLGK